VKVRLKACAPLAAQLMTLPLLFPPASVTKSNWAAG